MKLVGGSIEKGKERLAQFFIKHDAEITQEQAAYLANFTMTLLTDVGGRMLFHQVAAKGFNKARKGGKKVAKGASKVVTCSLNNLNTLRGAKVSEVIRIIPKNWKKMPLKKGDGVRYINPANPGESILIEHGWNNAKDLLHSGPYVRIARDGKVIRIPLSGNPSL